MRLQRVGKRGQAYFRAVVTEHTKKSQGESLELLGSYDPHKKNLQIDKERLEYWMSKGVKPSPTLNNLLINNNIISGDKMVSWKPKPKEKAPEAPAQEAAPAPAAEPAPEQTPEPVQEAPAEEPKAE